MPYFFERTALILLAGTALTACATRPEYAINPPVVQLPPAVQSPAVQAPSALAQAETVPTLQFPAPVEVAQAQPPLLAFAASGEDAFARTRARAPSATYTVQKGDTLEKIANRFGSDIETVAKANGLKKPYRLQPGQVLKNPKAPAPAAPASKSSAGRASGGDGGTYTVKSGDTLFAIAQRNGTTVEALRAANGMGSRSSLAAGQKLKLPGSGAPASRAERAPAADDDAALADRMAEAAQRRGGPAGREPFDPPGDVRGGAGGAGGDRAATGRVISIDVPGKAYSVKKGDTLERIAGRLDSDITELAKINKLKKPYRLQPGQTIRGPGTSAKAYVTARGDTLADIARRFGVTEAELRSANGLRRGAAIAAGRRLRLPAGYRDRGPVSVAPRIPETPPSQPPVARPPSSFDTPPPVGQRLPPPRSAPRPPEVVLPDQPQPYRPTPGVTPPSGTPFPRTGPVAGAPVASPPVSDAEISQMGRGLFTWPIQGSVISGFGGRGTGPRNDGLNIRGNAGDPVRAAAAGDVVYAGDQVPGFGNLVLVKHADGWVTAYGHLGRVDVRMQEKVTQGQQIGQVGTSGGVSEPQLHFEVRYAPTPQERARPVDPSLVLPK